MMKIIGVALTGIILIKILNEKNEIYSFSTQLFGLLLLISLIIPLLLTVFNKINSSFIVEYVGSDIIKTVIKLCGIAFISSVAVDICMDCSQASFAYIVECAGNIAMLIAVFPLISDVLETITELMNFR